MDPNATLDHIASTLNRLETHTDYEGDGLELDYACQELFDWLANGGFEPDWSRHELASSYYRCRAVGHSRGERVVEADY